MANVLLGIRFIFISHIHLDHNLGLFYLLKKIEEQKQAAGQHAKQQGPIYLLLPYNIGPFLKSYFELGIDLRQRVKIVFCQDYANSAHLTSPEEAKSAQSGDLKGPEKVGVREYSHHLEQEIIDKFFVSRLKDLEDFRLFLHESHLSIQVAPVVHCTDAHGIAITHQSQVKIAYSGDTRPCSNFSTIARDSTLVIHEATYSSEFQENAISNNHSTIAEAAEVALAANCRYLVATHFSQRFKNVVMDLKESGEQQQQSKVTKYLLTSSCLAFDNLRFRLRDIDEYIVASKCIEELAQEN